MTRGSQCDMWKIRVLRRGLGPWEKVKDEK